MSPDADDLKAGLPPLARRELLQPCRDAAGARSTSARAERTSRSASRLPRGTVYLRSRGENVRLAFDREGDLGLPPLARREPGPPRDGQGVCRSTSARAERTGSPATHRCRTRVYLRSRGENVTMRHSPRSHPGLPPLARRELSRHANVQHADGSTSARAERTSPRSGSPRGISVYLRSRGENVISVHRSSSGMGLPPLARRERHVHHGLPRDPRSTSARAERTHALAALLHAR